MSEEQPAALRSGFSPATARQRYAEELLREAEERMSQDVDPMSLIQSDEQGRSLGGLGAVRRFVRGESRAEVLREALEGLAARGESPFARSQDQALAGAAL
jgi:hypothetical protein